MNASNNLQYNYTGKITLGIGKKHHQNFLPTLELLKSSLLVSISGSLRIYIASILLMTHINILNCVAGGLIVYAIYTLDRALESKEDSINKLELKGANRKLALFISMIVFFLGCYVLNSCGLLFIALMPLVTGYLYSKGISFGKFNFKLKGGRGIKNFIVGITWGIFITFIAGVELESILPLIIIFLYYSFKLFINSALYDFKDIKGDIIAGIKTIPVSIGEENTRNLLLTLHIISHSLLATAIIMHLLAFEPVILLYSLFIGIFYIYKLSNNRENESVGEKIERIFLIDGEAGSILCVRSVFSSIL
jgi:4-hydroxybenzoate polyprenyltransferase